MSAVRTPDDGETVTLPRALARHLVFALTQHEARDCEQGVPGDVTPAYGGGSWFYRWARTTFNEAMALLPDEDQRLIDSWLGR